jgi:ABC-type transporter lipoprotein component MlaA
MLLFLGLARVADGQQSAAGLTNPPPSQSVVLPKGISDPIETVNRVLWAVNKGLLLDVVQPTAKVYRAVVVKPVRAGIGNMGTNVTYPDRLINNLLQGKWSGAGDETYRFLVNSTIGIAGFFDIASKWKVPRSPADFGQTFGTWGWNANFFIMLPVFGPSDDRDTVGLAADEAANPLLYFDPSTLNFEDPLNYEGPYSFFLYGVAYNDLSDSVDDYARFIRSEMDPYADIKYAWTFEAATRVANFQVKGKRDPSSLETLESVFFTYKDPEFPSRGKTLSVLIPTTGRKLKFSLWLQPDKAPVVYIIPGLGSHRLAETSVALAELVYKHGFSAVCVSSPFNAEFMEAASTAAVPGYLPVDGHDMQTALAAIDRKLNGRYGDRLDGKELMGYSMGAFETLYLASIEQTNPAPAIKFDRYLAVNTPVRLLHGVSVLDAFYRAPLAWPAAERTADIENTYLKVATLSKHKLTPRTSLPFNAIESKFLIGVTFRFILRDIIYSSQRRDNLGVLRLPIRNFNRDALYQEILHYSYEDYYKDFVVPYYQSRGMESAPATLDRAGDLRSYDAGLRGNTNVWAIVNENDFLLGDDDLGWLRSTFAPGQLTIFQQGGHLGNLYNPGVQKIILGALEGIKHFPPRRR